MPRLRHRDNLIVRIWADLESFQPGGGVEAAAGLYRKYPGFACSARPAGMTGASRVDLLQRESVERQRRRIERARLLD